MLRDVDHSKDKDTRQAMSLLRNVFSTGGIAISTDIAAAALYYIMHYGKGSGSG